MKKNNVNLFLILILILISVIIYLLQLLIFRSPRDTEFYLLQDLAFMPLQVAIVSLFLNSFINEREKRTRLKKMNMAINAFFSGTGTSCLLALKQFVQCDREMQTALQIGVRWKPGDFDRIIPLVDHYDFKVDVQSGNLESLKAVLDENRGFLMSMLENSNLLEHDAFTDMLWALFHIMDELSAREEFAGLPQSDLSHLSLDVRRAYVRLLSQWISYMKHLEEDYPYLFSMAVRKNPYDDLRSIIIRQ
ncbi:MAG: hypothetical protein ACYCYM_04260 [Saccharofermentanales bacterium]